MNKKAQSSRKPVGRPRQSSKKTAEQPQVLDQKLEDQSQLAQSSASDLNQNWDQPPVNYNQYPSYQAYPQYGYNPAPYAVDQRPFNGLAIAGFCCIMVSVVLFFVLFLTTALWVLGIILALMGLSEVKKYNQRGRELALTAVIVACISAVIYSMIVFLFFIYKDEIRDTQTEIVEIWENKTEEADFD